MMGGFGLFGGLPMILVWLLPILLIVWLATSWLGDGSNGSGGKTALDFLKEAYARGEITRDEFLKKQIDIQKG